MNNLNNPTINKYFATMEPKFISNIKSFDITDSETAKQLASDVCVVLCEKLNALPNDVDPYEQFCDSYIRTICRNIAYGYRRDPFISDRDSFYVSVSDEEDAALVISPRVEKYASLMNEEYDEVREEKLRFIEGYISDLPPKKQDLFVGHYIYGESYEELALELGYANAAVAKVTNNRILNDLRKVALQRFAS